MTYFKHSEEHEIDCKCSYCMDVDVDKSIAREIERVIEVVYVKPHRSLMMKHIGK